MTEPSGVPRLVTRAEQECAVVRETAMRRSSRGWASRGLAPAAFMWESYLNEPDPARPEETRTLVSWPVA